MALIAGTTLGRYEVRSKLGAGGMGEVYLAEDIRLHRRVALKILPADLASSKDRMRRFEQEATAAAALNHPNIAHIYEIGEHDGTHFIAMEFVDGVTLRQKIHRERTELRKLLRYLQHVAEGLAKAHAAGIVHRDLKPANIMITRDGHAKILDFGLAKLIEPQPTDANAGDADEEVVTAIIQQHSIAGVIMGTPGYMSPEQAQGKTGEIDQRSDVFSFGCILFEAATRKKPFEGDSIIKSLHSLIYEPTPTIQDLNPEAPAELQRIIRRCLAKDKEERYQTIKEVAIELKALRRELEAGTDFETTVPPSGTYEKALSTDLGSAVHSTAGRSRSLLPPVSSAEYIVQGLKTHRLFVALALVILIGGVAFSAYYLYARNREVAIDSLAVLPFANDTGDPEMEYLSDGLSESLINNLSQLPRLKVISRSSAFRYKRQEIAPEEVARALGVKAILTGRILRHGETTQISVELVNASDKTQIWGAQYNRSGKDVMAVQQEIAQEISRNLRLKLSSAEQSRLGNLHTANAEAYELYLKGRFYWNKRTGEALKQSVDYFNQAIEKDPNYALAYVGLADAYIVIPFFSVGSPQDTYPKAKAAARRALEIDDSLAEAHTALAAVLLDYDWNLPASNSEFERAIELNPNYANAHHWYARENLTIMGQYDRAVAEMRRAQELDPLSLIINANYGKAYFNARRYDEAIQQLRKTIDIDQSFFVAHHYLGSAYAMKGDYSAAMAEYQKAHQLNEYDPHTIALIGRLYAVTGQRAEALKVLEQLKSIATQRYVADYSLALIYAGLGEKDQAFALLEKSYRDHTVDMLTLYYDPLIDNLRSDPRFADLLRRVGLK